MPNRWIIFVKKWASDNNFSYGCALSKPELKAAYNKEYPKINKLPKGVAEAKKEDELPKKKGYKLYVIEYNGSKGELKRRYYFIENSRKGLSFKDRKVYDSGLPTDGYIYKFHPIDKNEKIDLTHLEAGSFLGTLEQAPVIAKKVKGGIAF